MIQRDALATQKESGLQRHPPVGRIANGVKVILPKGSYLQRKSYLELFVFLFLSIKVKKKTLVTYFALNST